MSLEAKQQQLAGFIVKVKPRDGGAVHGHLDAAANFHVMPEMLEPKGVMTQSHNVG